ncbi:hypothetical protein ACLIA0_07455 [Bacillaceae bacterium W0354]
MYMNGQIISGNLDQINNEFIIKQVKHLETVSIVEREQLQMLYQYLSKQDHPEGQVVTLDDQMLIHFNQNEIQTLLKDIKVILERLQSIS